MENVVSLINNASKDSITKKELYKAICMDVAVNLQADMISLWFFNETQDEMQAGIVYHAKTNSYSEGLILKRSDYPSYFKEILHNVYLAANDVRNHAALEELVDGYFDKFNIKSLLDFMLQKNNKPVGVICVETIDAPKKWTDEHIQYLRTITTLAARPLNLDE